MSYVLDTTRKFEKDVKKCKKRGYDISKLKQCLLLLTETGTLPSEYKPHKLSGRFSGIWECHIESDWLLMWKQDDDRLVLLMLQTGTHSDLY